MNQAQRYEHLVGLTEGKKLDSDYRAAFYILSSVPELLRSQKNVWMHMVFPLTKSKDHVKEIWRSIRASFCLWHITFSHGTAGRPPRPMNCPVLPIRGWRLPATLSSYPVERFLCCYRRMKVGSQSWFWMQHLMRKQRGYTKDCKEWESGWRTKWKKQMQRKGKERKIGNGRKAVKTVSNIL